MKLNFRMAKKTDLLHLVSLLGDDVIGSKREDLSMPLNQRYIDAFHRIEKKPDVELAVVELKGALIGMMQLIFIPCLTHIGSWRCQIEGVRIAKNYRGQGIGTSFMKWAVARAGERNCSIMQLTSDKLRADALRFYESMGFQATHKGFKLKL